MMQTCTYGIYMAYRFHIIGKPAGFWRGRHSKVQTAFTNKYHFIFHAPHVMCAQFHITWCSLSEYVPWPDKDHGQPA